MFHEADGFETSEKLTLKVVYSDDDYAEQIKAYRKRHNLKTGEIAMRFGVCKGTINNWEGKKKKPPLHTWRRIKEIIDGDDVTE